MSHIQNCRFCLSDAKKTRLQNILRSLHFAEISKFSPKLFCQTQVVNASHRFWHECEMILPEQELIEVVPCGHHNAC
jgi:hypothetical protein